MKKYINSRSWEAHNFSAGISREKLMFLPFMVIFVQLVSATCSMMSSMEYFYLNEPFCWLLEWIEICILLSLKWLFYRSLLMLILSLWVVFCERGFVNYHSFVSAVMGWQQFFRHWLSSHHTYLATLKRDKIISMCNCISAIRIRIEIFSPLTTHNYAIYWLQS